MISSGSALVSIVVPVYNVEKYLSKCIESIVNQSYENLDVILVDDGSPDGCSTICDKYAHDDGRVRVIHKTNGGLVSAWKCGLNEAKADWVVFVDGDDWIEKDHISSLVKEQEKSNADIVVTFTKEVTKSRSRLIEFEVPLGNYSGSKMIQELYPVMINSGGFEKRGIPCSRFGKLIRKRLMIANLAYEFDHATYKEDFNIVYPTLMDAHSISLISDENSGYCYRRTEGSMLHGYDSNMFNSAKAVHARVIRAVKDKNKPVFESQLLSEFLSSMVRCYTNELQNPDGINTALGNIRNIASDGLFLDSVKKVTWSNYPGKFKLIIHSLRNQKGWNLSIIYMILRVAKMISK